MGKPDYEHWDAQPEYYRDDAAALCCDLEPEPWNLKTNPTPRRVSAMALRLQREVPSEDTTRRGTEYNTSTREYYGIVTSKHRLFRRANLRQWAEATGQRALMPFLFPEDREPEEAAEAPPMRADSREALLLLIGLLAHALAEKGGPDLKTDRGPKQAGIIRELRKAARKLGVPMDGLSDTTLQERLKDALTEVGNRKPSTGK